MEAKRLRISKREAERSRECLRKPKRSWESPRPKASVFADGVRFIIRKHLSLISLLNFIIAHSIRRRIGEPEKVLSWKFGKEAFHLSSRAFKGALIFGKSLVRFS